MRALQGPRSRTEKRGGFLKKLIFRPTLLLYDEDEWSVCQAVSYTDTASSFMEL